MSAVSTQAGLSRILTAASFLQAVSCSSVGTRATSPYALPSHCVSARLYAFHICVSVGRPSTHRGRMVIAAVRRLDVVMPGTTPSTTSSSVPWRQPTFLPDSSRRHCHVTTVSAKLYADTGYGRVVQHHQRTSSQQFYNLLYNKFTTSGQKFATCQHLDMSRCWALALRCGKFVVQQVVELL